MLHAVDQASESGVCRGSDTWSWPPTNVTGGKPAAGLRQQVQPSLRPVSQHGVRAARVNQSFTCEAQITSKTFRRCGTPTRH